MIIFCLFGHHKWSSWVEIADIKHCIRHCGRCPMTELRIGV